jgi:hypothetical protein
VQLSREPHKTNYTWETANARILECKTAQVLHKLEMELLSNDPLFPLKELGVLIGRIEERIHSVPREGFDVEGRFDKIRR